MANLLLRWCGGCQILF